MQKNVIFSVVILNTKSCSIRSKMITFFIKARYKIDHLPIRGLVRSKVYLGFKISAINCKRLIKGLINRPIPELFTLLYSHLFFIFSFQRTSRVKFAA